MVVLYAFFNQRVKGHGCSHQKVPGIEQHRLPLACDSTRFLNLALLSDSTVPGGNITGTKMNTNTCTNRHRFDRIESQVRLLADSAFLMRDYSTAASMYRMARDDFRSDRCETRCYVVWPGEGAMAVAGVAPAVALAVAQVAAIAVAVPWHRQ